MTRLTASQDAHLRKIVAQRARLDRQLAKADDQREYLNELLHIGRQLGISTHRMAEAAALSQPRVQQIVGPK